MLQKKSVRAVAGYKMTVNILGGVLEDSISILLD